MKPDNRIPEVEPEVLGVAVSAGVPGVPEVLGFPVIVLQGSIVIPDVPEDSDELAVLRLLGDAD